MYQNWRQVWSIRLNGALCTKHRRAVAYLVPNLFRYTLHFGFALKKYAAYGNGGSSAIQRDQLLVTEHSVSREVPNDFRNAFEIGHGKWGRISRFWPEKYSSDHRFLMSGIARIADLHRKRHFARFGAKPDIAFGSWIGI